MTKRVKMNRTKTPSSTPVQMYRFRLPTCVRLFFLFFFISRVFVCEFHARMAPTNYIKTISNSDSDLTSSRRYLTKEQRTHDHARFLYVRTLLANNTIREKEYVTVFLFESRANTALIYDTRSLEYVEHIVDIS